MLDLSIALENVIIVLEPADKQKINLKPIMYWQIIPTQGNFRRQKKCKFKYCIPCVSKFSSNLTKYLNKEWGVYLLTVQ